VNGRYEAKSGAHSRQISITGGIARPGNEFVLEFEEASDNRRFIMVDRRLFWEGYG
jgi:hypothetical protein